MVKYGDIGPKVAAFSVRRMLESAKGKLNLDNLAQPRRVESIDDFRALPGAERARRTVDVLKRLGRFTDGMTPRELEDHEIVAALLIGNGQIAPAGLQSGDTVKFSGKKYIVA